MRLSRRSILKSAGALPLLAGSFGLPLFGLQVRAQTAPAAVPPVLFVHGSGDHAALWITTLWRMESNGVPRDRMLAISFTDRAKSESFRWSSGASVDSAMMS